MWLNHHQRTKTTESLKLTTKIPVVINGFVAFRDAPIKNAVVEFFIQGSHGEAEYPIGKTFSALSGHFYFQTYIPLAFAEHVVGVRLCAYSTPAKYGHAFPLFLGIHTFIFKAHERTYDLGTVEFPLEWSFCKDPVILTGEVANGHLLRPTDYGDYLVRLVNEANICLAENIPDVDGHYHLYTSLDFIAQDPSQLFLRLSYRNQATIRRLILVDGVYVYRHDLKIETAGMPGAGTIELSMS